MRAVNVAGRLPDGAWLWRKGAVAGLLLAAVVIFMALVIGGVFR
jgi:hypothetical protein